MSTITLWFNQTWQRTISHLYLVGGVEHFLFPSSWDGVQSDELIFFRGVGQPPTRRICYADITIW